MLLLNPQHYEPLDLDDESREMIEKTIAFFETRGLKRLKHDDHERVWYADFLEFLKQEQIFARLLTPPGYGTESSRWDTWRNCAFNEVVAFYGLNYWYTWQVTILGLGPLWMSGNEKIRQKTAEFLRQGGIFAFGLSEKQHGADLYASEMTLYPQDDGTWKARGGKYYIGNANKAALVSVFGKIHGSEDFVFFAVDSQHERFKLVKNVVNSQNYVAEFSLDDYPITEDDILSRGREAWDASLNTVNVGKFNLGWASIGICTHAFYEAIEHAANRRLFNTFVTDFVHIRQLFVDAWCRLQAMKLFATRASDYMRAASPSDRRYLLYNPMVKMKVTTQGEEVINLLWDVIAARGFEKDVYFEMAARDIRALPKLEGTVHVNMALVIKFMANYFFKPGKFPEIGRQTQREHDAFLFDQGPTKGLGKITFHDYHIAYNLFDSKNIREFKKQITTLRTYLMIAKPTAEQTKDFDYLLNLGELFTLVAYGQLVLENAKLLDVDIEVIDQIFDFMVRDFSKFALQLSMKPSSTWSQILLARMMIKRPVFDRKRYEHVWEKYVYSQVNAYAMNEEDGTATR